jgi:hypothetical protein
LPTEPSPLLDPLGDTYFPARTVVGSMTVTLEVPPLPSLVAVIVADPVATPVISPAPDTVAMVVALLDHVTARPVSALPAESLVVTVSCRVNPMFTPPDAGDTTTDDTGTSVTVIAAVPLWLSLVAVIVAEPTPTAVTSPLAPTVATPGALLDHVTVRPVSTFPLASFVMAVS